MLEAQRPVACILQYIFSMLTELAYKKQFPKNYIGKTRSHSHNHNYCVHIAINEQEFTLAKSMTLIPPFFPFFT